jgi:hypothetical protein
MGRPTSELKLPTLRKTFLLWARTAPISSLVVVLPTEPVTPTTGIGYRSRWARPSCPSASRGSGTSTRAVPRAATGRPTMMHAAPASAAFAA